MKTFADIQNCLNSGNYNTKLEYPRDVKLPNTFIFDENKSIVWNKQRVKDHNKLIEDKLREYRNDEIRLNNLFRDDLVEAISNEASISHSASEKIFEFAYEHGHAYGYHDVLIKATEVAELISEIIILNNKEVI